MQLTPHRQVSRNGCRNEHAHHLKGKATDVNGQATDQKINLRAALESRTPDLRITSALLYQLSWAALCEP